MHPSDASMHQIAYIWFKNTSFSQNILFYFTTVLFDFSNSFEDKIYPTRLRDPACRRRFSNRPYALVAFFEPAIERPFQGLLPSCTSWPPQQCGQKLSELLFGISWLALSSPMDKRVEDGDRWKGLEEETLKLAAIEPSPPSSVTGNTAS